MPSDFHKIFFSRAPAHKIAAFLLVVLAGFVLLMIYIQVRDGDPDRQDGWDERASHMFPIKGADDRRPGSRGLSSLEFAPKTPRPKQGMPERLGEDEPPEEPLPEELPPEEPPAEEPPPAKKPWVRPELVPMKPGSSASGGAETSAFLAAPGKEEGKKKEKEDEKEKADPAAERETVLEKARRLLKGVRTGGK